MENLFQCYHGEANLRAGKDSVKKLTEYVKNLVSSGLPEDVIRYFVHCRLHFRMRILNKKLAETRKTKRKMSKLVKPPPKKLKTSPGSNVHNV